MSHALKADSFGRFYHNRLFEGIETEVLDDIRQEVNVLQFSPGQVVFNAGDPGDSLYLVGEGSVKISKQGNTGCEETLGYVHSGNFFGEVALLNNEPHSAMATAVEPTLLGALNKETFQH